MRAHASALLAVLLVSACGASQIPAPTAPTLAAARARWPDATLAELTTGRGLYVERCAGCHDLVVPAAHSAEEWAVLVDAMRTEEEVELSALEAAQVTRYLGATSDLNRAR